MPLPLPTSLSPSKISSFTDCPLAFRFSAVDRIPSPPTVATVKGTLVHSALERLLTLTPAERTAPAAQTCLAAARAELPDDPEWIELALPVDQHAEFFASASQLVDRYFTIEDPTTIDPVGLELQLEHPIDDSGAVLRGIIDRLETDAEGEFVITDYKTGRSPGPRYEQSRLTGVHIYSYLVEKHFGRRPSRVQLFFLGDQRVVSAAPTDQSTRQIERKVTAIWSTVVNACANDSFQPKESRLCDWCSYQAFCPAKGGSIALAVETAAELQARRRGA